MLGALIETSQWALRRKGFCVKSLTFVSLSRISALPTTRIIGYQSPWELPSLVAQDDI
jgi:hypothetical protein